MKKGGIGGGKTITGLIFESRISLEKVLSTLPGYKVISDIVYFKDGKVAEIYQKHKLYKNLLEPNGIDYTKVISKKLLPDDAILILKDKILYIIEMKFQVRWTKNYKRAALSIRNTRNYLPRLISPLNMSMSSAIGLKRKNIKMFCNM